MAIRALRKKLLHWFAQNKRDLPFRKTLDPYQIWLSEIMLQQTTMAVAVPYFTRFVKKFPGVFAVAKAHDAALLNAWKGLGYYARVRNFKLACIDVCEKYGGIIPKDFDKIRALKGVGDYTAAAVSSICFGHPHPAIDGNVRRVIARLFYFTGNAATSSTQGFFKEKAEMLLDRKFPGDFNQALMELGATVCAKTPLCHICPVSKFCASFGKDPVNLPIKHKMRYRSVNYSSLILHRQDMVLLKKPSAKNLIKDMWELPSCYAGKVTNHIPRIEKKLSLTFSRKKLLEMGFVKHNITNKRITAHVFCCELTTSDLTKPADSDFTFIKRRELKNIPLNTLAQKALQKFGPWSKN